MWGGREDGGRENGGREDERTRGREDEDALYTEMLFSTRVFYVFTCTCI